MADQFSNWDRFHANHLVTQDARKAATWTRYQLWAEKRRLRRLKNGAERLALQSAAATPGRR